MNTFILPQTCTKVKDIFTKRLMKTLSVTSVAGAAGHPMQKCLPTSITTAIVR